MAGAVETVIISAVTYSVYGLGNADPVGDADDYFAARLGATSWTGATADQKAQALVTAVRSMDRRSPWTGTKTVSTQALEWPRDSATCDGEAVADGTIPNEVVLGSFEYALALLEDESTQDASGTGSNIKRVKAGSAEVEFFTPTLETSANLLFPQVVHELISCYFQGSTGIAPYITGNSSTGTNQTSSFDCEDYGLSEGYP